MDHQTKKKRAELTAKAMFEQRFRQHMKNNNVEAFKKDYRTLYHHVIIPVISERCLMADLHSEAEATWERLMMELVGEDGTGSVRKSIEQIKKESSAHFDEVMKQRETIKDLQEALRSARLFILRQGASTEAAEAYEKVNQALSKTRNQ